MLWHSNIPTQGLVYKELLLHEAAGYKKLNTANSKKKGWSWLPVSVITEQRQNKGLIYRQKTHIRFLNVQFTVFIKNNDWTAANSFLKCPTNRFGCKVFVFLCTIAKPTGRSLVSVVICDEKKPREKLIPWIIPILKAHTVWNKKTARNLNSKLYYKLISHREFPLCNRRHLAHLNINS